MADLSVPAGSGAAASAHQPTSTPEDDRALQRQKSIEQAIAEGHDADIPSDIGYVLDEAGEELRRKSIADQRRHSLAKKRSNRSHAGASRDVEKGVDATAAGDTASEGKDDGGATSDDEANIVWWDGDDDVANPYNWPTWLKIVNCSLISISTLVTPLGSSIFAPAVPQLMKEFQSDNLELASFVVSVYVLGFACGPLLIAPLSEIYGRLIVYHVCNIGFIAFLVGCALAPSLNALIVFRFFSGAFGSCPITNGGGTIADMIVQEKRAGAMAAFSIGPLLGPIIGPIAGGFLAEAEGWRWVFWLLVILAGVLSISMVIFARETYAPVLLQRKVNRLRKETGNDLLRSKLDAGLTPKEYFRRGIIRPLKLLVFSPYCIIFAIYISIIYGYLYLMFTSITDVFMRGYGFSISTVGLVFLGLGIGSLAGLLYFGGVSDRDMKAKKANGEEMKPEHRLRLLPAAAIMLPVGFFIYGWTAEKHVHWIVPILSHVPIGIAMVMTFMAISMALVDSFTLYAASALAANTVIRSIFGAVLPLCGLRMYRVLGLGWGNSLLAFVSMPLIPVAFLILKYGETIRTKYPVKNI
ncbi:major facilitator superfamily domain-containing protein [Cercophora newfieldiana]|uniref:Major facilitator superfamily domain-containing protein n=1 Tax=Cercophora newfieldiana TaxID=92897 RepID=A0AA40CS81_9PEZI|nr:major facilitator superfamily domain-containing protein [Cercophora newfieldiana]